MQKQPSSLAEVVQKKVKQLLITKMWQICLFFYKLGASSYNQGAEFELANCLFEGMQLSQSTDPDKYGYSIILDWRYVQSLRCQFGKNLAIFSSLVHVNNTKKDI